MKKTMNGLLVLCIIFVISGCKSISPEAKEGLAKEVDCTSAQDDLLLLEAEKASVGKQVSSGVRSILPAAAVIGILSGDYKDRVSVATGKYNKDIDAKIQEIKDACGIE